jgi:hypothetical protein
MRAKAYNKEFARHLRDTPRPKRKEKEKGKKKKEEKKSERERIASPPEV